MAPTKDMLTASILLIFLATIMSHVEAADLQDIIETAFRDAIVKIEVSTNTRVLKDGIDICVSEGTGFLISSSYAATAEHVYKLAPECGNPIIILKSRKHNAQRLAEIVGSNNDIALLKVDQPLSPEMCVLRVMPMDIFGSKGIRFGIPGDLLDPESVPIKIGEKDTEFSPLVVLTPTITEAGESGGPVIHQFNVVGVTRAKHEKYRAYSFMTTGSNLKFLIGKYDIKLEGRVCNPVEIHTYRANDDINAATILELNKLPGVGAELADYLHKSGRLISRANPSVYFDNKSATIRSNRLADTFEVRRQILQDNIRDVESAANIASTTFQRDLWEKFIEEGTRMNKWN